MDEEKKQNDSQDEGLEKDKQPSMDQGDVVPGSSPDVTEDKSAEDKEGEGDVSSELSPEELEAISKGLEVLGEEGGESIPEIPDLESSGSDAAQLSIDELIASVKSSSPFDLSPLLPVACCQTNVIFASAGCCFYTYAFNWGELRSIKRWR